MRCNSFQRYIMIILVVGTFCFTFISCATTGNFKTAMDSYINHDVNEAIMKLGPPSNEYTMPNGNKMYTWLWVGGTLVTANYNDFLNIAYANSVTYYCKMTFIANPGGLIVSWQAQGNSCRCY
jgi:hypothetical protein